MEFPDDENGDVLRRLQSDGDDLTQPRDIDFIVAFPEGRAAQEFAAQMQRSGYNVVVEQNNTSEQFLWDARIIRNMVPTHEAITGFEVELEELASPYQGRNDGWGCLTQSGSSNPPEE